MKRSRGRGEENENKKEMGKQEDEKNSYAT